MKKFIKILIIFGLWIFGLATVADFVISKNLRKIKDSVALSGWNYILSNKNLKHNAIIMGDSRGMEHYNPVILDSLLHFDFYNLGIEGGRISGQMLKYNTYRQFNRQPDIIIYEINHSSMCLGSGPREQFFPHFHNRHFLEQANKLCNFSIFEMYMPLYRYAGYPALIQAGMGLGEINNRADLTKGYYPVPVSRGFYRNTEEKQNEISINADSTAIYLFKNFLSQVHQKSKIILVYSPVYIEITENIRNIDKLYQMYDGIAKQYDITILYYNKDSICCDSTLFVNVNHLNEKGANLFTTKLAHDIDSLKFLH